MTTPMAKKIIYKKKSEKFSERLAKRTKLSETEIERLVRIFNEMTVIDKVHLKGDSDLSLKMLRFLQKIIAESFQTC